MKEEKTSISKQVLQTAQDFINRIEEKTSSGQEEESGGDPFRISRNIMYFPEGST